ncbi:hypothetical protein ES703_125255 [subsurface metagenome]
MKTNCGVIKTETLWEPMCWMMKIRIEMVFGHSRMKILVWIVYMVMTICMNQATRTMAMMTVI